MSEPMRLPLRDQQELDVTVLRACALEYLDSAHALAGTPGLERIAAMRLVRSETLHAILERYSALVDRIETTEAERNEWRDTAISLGVQGEYARDTSRQVLDLRMKVDAGLLRQGGISVLDVTLMDMRGEYAKWLRAEREKDPMEAMARALALALADKERRDRRGERAAPADPHHNED
jgi:hypothetical protein